MQPQSTGYMNVHNKHMVGRQNKHKGDTESAPGHYIHNPNPSGWDLNVRGLYRELTTDRAHQRFSSLTNVYFTLTHVTPPLQFPISRDENFNTDSLYIILVKNMYRPWLTCIDNACLTSMSRRHQFKHFNFLGLSV